MEKPKFRDKQEMLHGVTVLFDREVARYGCQNHYLPSLVQKQRTSRNLQLSPSTLLTRQYSCPKPNNNSSVCRTRLLPLSYTRFEHYTEELDKLEWPSVERGNSLQVDSNDVTGEAAVWTWLGLEPAKCLPRRRRRKFICLASISKTLPRLASSCKNCLTRIMRSTFL